MKLTPKRPAYGPAAPPPGGRPVRTPDAPRPAGRTTTADVQKRYAREAVKEKRLSRYLHLECGHYAGLEILEQYKVFRPKRGHAMCEHGTCGQWRKILVPPAPPPYPQEPMF